jgi:PAS domain S-box-containing protein
VDRGPEVHEDRRGGLAADDRFVALFDVPLLMRLSGPAARCTLVSAGWSAFTGRPMDEELNDGWAEGVFPDDLERCLGVYHHAFVRGIPFQTTYRLRRADGTYRWLVEHGAPFLGSDGAFAGYLSGCIDVTGHKEDEQSARAAAKAAHDRFSALAAVSRALAATFDPEAILGDVARLVVPSFADHCLVDLIEPDGSVRRIPPTVDPGDVRSEAAESLSRFPPDPANRLHPATRAIATGESQLLAELTGEDLAGIATDADHLAASRALEPISALSVPMHGRGVVVGAVTLITTRASGRHLSAQDIPAAEEVGCRIGIALENARLFAREHALIRTLQTSEQRYRSLVEATTTLVWTTDAAGAFVDPQPGWQAYTGQTWSDYAGYGWVDALHPDDREVVEGEWRKAQARGDRYETRARIWHAPSGQYRHVVERAAPLRDERGEIDEWVGNITDVHDEVVSRQEVAERAQHLLQLTVELAAALSEEEIADLLASRLSQVLGADTFVLGRLDERRRMLVPVRMAGFTEEMVTDFSEIPLDRPSAAADTVRTGQPLFLSSAAEYLARYPELAGWRAANQLESWAHVPLVADGRAIGLVHLGFRRQRELRVAERVFLETVTAAAGQAWQRAAILRAERAAARRLRQVQELSDIALGRLALPDLLDALLARLRAALDVDVGRILLVDDEGRRLEVAASVGYDGVVDARHTTIAVGDGFAGRVAAARGPLTTEAAAGQLDAGNALDGDSLRSGAGVPLLVDARLVGVLDVGTHQPRTFTDDDVELLKLAAERIAVAIDRTRASDLQRSLAHTLQASLLPPTVPEIPGVEVATCYRAAGEGTEVGGDFYDLFPDGHGGWYLVIGDVCGRGVSAAGLTGLARHTVRVVAPERRSPAAILTRLNQVLTDSTDDEHFATVACAHLTHSGAGLLMAVASGGHCPVLIRRAGGAVEPVPATGGLLGLFPDVELSDVVVELGQGDAAVFHTDGVTEAHGADGLFGDARLADVVAKGPAQTAAELSATLEHSVVAYSAGRISDDLAIVVIRPDLGQLAVDIVFPLSAEAAHLGRRSLAHLRGDLPTRAQEEARLIVSELVTNAVRHGSHDEGAFGAGRLRVWVRPGRLRVEVTSPGSFEHPPASALPLAEGGRGLQIVRALAVNFGMDHTESESTVWAEVEVVGAEQ